MKVDLYNAIVSAQMSRRKMLKGSASLGAVAAMGGLGGAASAGAHGGVRAEIMKIPGVGMGSPGDPEWQKVGELCMGPVKERVAEGEFKGVELTFMGLNKPEFAQFPL